MKTIAVLLTVFNRKDKTLRCLQCLYAQKPVDDCQIDVYLTDDGCTDGTPEAVREKYPQVNVIDAKGDLFWNRGMYTAWEEAAKKDYDFYMWLNDDTYLYDNAVMTLFDNSQKCANKSVIVSATKDSNENVTTYSGKNRHGKIIPNGTLQECDTFNGNCVLIPRCVFKKVGNLDWAFRHAIGDLDYGYRVKAAGFKSFVAPIHLGTCDNCQHQPDWVNANVPLRKRLKNLYSPLGYAEPLPFFHYERKNFGLLIAIRHFVTIHIRVFFPQLWKS